MEAALTFFFPSHYFSVSESPYLVLVTYFVYAATKRGLGRSVFYFAAFFHPFPSVSLVSFPLSAVVSGSVTVLRYYLEESASPNYLRSQIIPPRNLEIVSWSRHVTKATRVVWFSSFYHLILSVYIKYFLVEFVLSGAILTESLFQTLLPVAVPFSRETKLFHCPPSFYPSSSQILFLFWPLRIVLDDLSASFTHIVTTSTAMSVSGSVS